MAEEDLFLGVPTLGEIRRGIEALRPRDATRAAVPEAWPLSFGPAFGPRILPVSAAVADAWGRFGATRSVPVIDALLAAAALVHDLTLVTRSTADVAGLGARVLDPFQAFG